MELRYYVFVVGTAYPHWVEKVSAFQPVITPPIVTRTLRMQPNEVMLFGLVINFY